MKRVNKVLIGKDIDRTASVQITAPGTTATYIAEGEVVVLDKNKNLLTAGSTVADTDTIYLAVGTSDTFDYTNEAGTLTENARRLAYSAPIKAGNITTYKGVEADSAATERKCTIDIDSATNFAPIVGTEYVIRVIYKDMIEHPGQFVQDFRVIATSTTPSDLTDAFVTAINSFGVENNDSRVTASNVSDDLVLVGKTITGNSTNDEIDDYRQVDFEVALPDTTLDADDIALTWEDVAVTYNTDAHPGNGNPKLVRDAEKHALAYEGITNYTHFPVVKPEMQTVMTKWYDSIVIESETPYISASLEYSEEAPGTTQLFIPANAGQTTNVLSVLNPWMESAGMNAVSV